GIDQAGRRERLSGRGRDGHPADGGGERRLRVRHPRRALGRSHQGGGGGGGKPVQCRTGDRVRGLEDRALQTPARGGLCGGFAARGGGRRGGPRGRQGPVG